MDLRAMRLQMLKRVLFPSEVCLGKGSLDRLGSLEPSRVLIVIGSSARRTGSLDRVSAQLKDATAREIIDLPAGEPRAELIENFREKVAEFAPEWIVAVGGGAVLDTAKFLWAQYEHHDFKASLSGQTQIGPMRQKTRMIAVPTTAGSGSEASQAAVLSEQDGTKVPYVSPHWIPDIVILDPALTVSMPRETTVATGFDALTHAVESAVSNLGTPFLGALAATTIRLILQHLKTATENPQDLTARAGMLEAAFLAGLCQSTASTGVAHALSHATSKLHGSAHGTATGFYLLPSMKWNRAKSAGAYDSLAVQAGFQNGASLEISLVELGSRLGVPQRFSELIGRSPDQAERQMLAEVASKDRCLRTNVCRLGVSELNQLLEQIA